MSFDSASSPTLISVRGVNKTYQRGNQPVPVLLGIDLDIALGDYVS